MDRKSKCQDINPNYYARSRAPTAKNNENMTKTRGHFCQPTESRGSTLLNSHTRWRPSSQLLSMSTRGRSIPLLAALATHAAALATLSYTSVVVFCSLVQYNGDTKRNKNEQRDTSSGSSRNSEGIETNSLAIESKSSLGQFKFPTKLSMYMNSIPSTNTTVLDADASSSSTDRSDWQSLLSTKLDGFVNSIGYYVSKSLDHIFPKDQHQQHDEKRPEEYPSLTKTIWASCTAPLSPNITTSPMLLCSGSKVATIKQEMRASSEGNTLIYDFNGISDKKSCPQNSLPHSGNITTRAEGLGLGGNYLALLNLKCKKQSNSCSPPIVYDGELALSKKDLNREENHDQKENLIIDRHGVDNQREIINPSSSMVSIKKKPPFVPLDFSKLATPAKPTSSSCKHPDEDALPLDIRRHLPVPAEPQTTTTFGMLQTSAGTTNSLPNPTVGVENCSKVKANRNQLQQLPVHIVSLLLVPELCV